MHGVHRLEHAEERAAHDRLAQRAARACRGGGVRARARVRVRVGVRAVTREPPPQAQHMVSAEKSASS